MFPNLSLLLSPKAMLIGSAAALAIGFASGFYTASKFAEAKASAIQAAHYQQQIDEANFANYKLKENMKEILKVLDDDAIQAKENADKIEELERKANENVKDATNNACFSEPTVERLRKFFAETSGARPPISGRSR